MGPTKVKTGSSKGANKRHTKKATAPRSKTKTDTNSVKKSRPKEHTKASRLKRWKPPKYTEAELNVPQLNMITPAGVEKPRGKKKGKVFVDDQESMMTILAMVNADKDGQIEPKMIKERQMEEIREARRKEMEARADQKKSKFEDTKRAVRRKGKHEAKSSDTTEASTKADGGAKKKRVSFAQS